MFKIPLLRLELLSLVESLFHRPMLPNLYASHFSSEMLRYVCDDYLFFPSGRWSTHCSVQAFSLEFLCNQFCYNIIGISKPRCLRPRVKLRPAVQRRTCFKDSAYSRGSSFALCTLRSMWRPDQSELERGPGRLHAAAGLGWTWLHRSAPACVHATAACRGRRSWP